MGILTAWMYNVYAPKMQDWFQEMQRGRMLDLLYVILLISQEFAIIYQ
jgi:hypothetical protein